MTNVAAGKPGSSAQQLFTPAGWRGEGQPPLYTAAQIAALVEAQQPAKAVPITVEQVEDAIGLQSTAWDTIGAEKIVEAVLRLANAQQPAHPEQQPFGWIKQSEIDSSKDFGGSINLWRRRYDCDVPVYLAQQPAPSAAAFDEHGFRDWVLRNLPKGSIIGNGEWWADHLTSWAKRFVKAAPQPSPTPQTDSAPASVAGPMQFGGCPECGSRSCVARECSRTVSHAAQAIPGVQWQCGPQASGFTAPQADSQPAPDNLRALFREALAWGMVYGPEIPAHQWDEMRESMVKQYTSRAARAPADPQLRKFYGVTTDAELISAQARHIERLQAKLPQTPSFAPQRVREG